MDSPIIEKISRGDVVSVDLSSNDSKDVKKITETNTDSNFILVYNYWFCFGCFNTCCFDCSVCDCDCSVCE